MKMPLRSVPDLPARQYIRVPFAITDMRAEKRAGVVDGFRLEGHATVFDYEYEVYGGPSNGAGWIERVATGAADATLAEDPDVVFLLNHEGMALARTKSGTLELGVDERGLPSSALLDAANPMSRAVLSGVERGDLDEMSFAFRTTAQEWRAHEDFPDDEMSLRVITEFNIHRGDVSVVNFGASDATDIDIVRSLDTCSLEELAEARAVIERRLKQTPDGMSGDEERGGMPLHLLELLRIPPNPILEKYHS